MSPGGGFDSGSPPAAYSMPEPTAYGGEGQFNTMSQVTNEARQWRFSCVVRISPPSYRQCGKKDASCSSRSLLAGV